MSSVQDRPRSGRNMEGPDLEVTVARTIEEIEELREIWEALPLSNVDSDIDHFLAVLGASTDVVRPHVVRIRRRDRPDLFGIARLENLEVPFKVGYRTLLRPRLRAVVVSHGGLVGAQDRDEVELLVREMRRPLQTREADALAIRSLDRSGSVFAVAMRAAGRWRFHGQPVRERWFAEPPASLDAFVASQSAGVRKEFRRCERRLRAGMAGEVRVHRFHDASEVDVLLRDLETVSDKGYQRGIGLGYRPGRLADTLIDLGLRRGWLRAWMLYLDEKPVAFWTALTYAGHFGNGSTAFDPEYATYSVGRFAMLRMVEDIADDDRISVLDLGQGHGDYKRVFHPRKVEESDVVLLAHRPRAALVALLASASAMVNRWGKKVTDETASGRRLVRRWQRSGAGSGRRA
jgi:CelD/BcsL family acetyltransferase involved in cellulose biosynthesis